MIDPKTAMRLLNDVKDRRESGSINDAEFQREVKIINENADRYVEHVREQSPPAQAKAHSMSAQQIAVLVHRCNGVDEMEAISARAHADRLGIDYKGGA